MQNSITDQTRKLLIIIMIVGCFFSTLNQTLLNVALSDFMTIFNVNASTVQWLSTGFMLVNGVLVPITAYLMKRFSTRQLFIASMLSLLIGSIICACAGNFSMLLAGRMIQAIGAGIIIPLMMTIVVYLYPPENRGKIMGNMGFAIIFAPAIAPTLAGFLLDFMSWRWLFILIIPFAAIIIVIAAKYLINVSETASVALDITSVVFSTIGFGFLLYGFSSAGSNGWNDFIVVASLLIGALCTLLFIVRQVRAAEPLLNLAVYRSKMFTMTSLLNIGITVVMYADLILLPLYLQNGRELTAFHAGLILLPGAIINAFLSPVAGKLFDRFGAKPMFISGTVIVAISMFLVLDLTSTTSITFIILRTILLRIGLAFITMPLNAAALNGLPRELASHGSAVNNTVRQLAGAIGTAVIVTIYSSQLQQATLNVADSAPLATAAGNTYMYMFIIACMTCICACFTPKFRKA